MKDWRHAELISCSSLFICAVPTSHGVLLGSASLGKVGINYMHGTVADASDVAGQTDRQAAAAASLSLWPLDKVGEKKKLRSDLSSPLATQQ